MTKIKTPSGEFFASSPQEAIDRCEREAAKEAKDSKTGIVSRIQGSEKLIIVSNKKTWVVYGTC